MGQISHQLTGRPRETKSDLVNGGRLISTIRLRVATIPELEHVSCCSCKLRSISDWHAVYTNLGTQVLDSDENPNGTTSRRIYKTHEYLKEIGANLHGMLSLRCVTWSFLFLTLGRFVMLRALRLDDV